MSVAITEDAAAFTGALADVRPTPVRADGNLVLGLIALGSAITVGLWWADTSSVHGLGGWLTNAGRICGLLAGYGVVMLVLLMARLPPLERGIGADRLARWQSTGGFHEPMHLSTAR